MKMNNKNYRQKAQSTVEYAMVIICVVAALIAMQIYIKRSIQGRIRDAADEIGEQYSAKHTTSEMTQKISNPQETKITGKPVFMTDAKGQKYEITEITREEKTQIDIGEGNYERTGEFEKNLFE